MVFEARCLNIRDVCMDFEPCFKVHNVVCVYRKSIKLDYSQRDLSCGGASLSIG